MCGEVAQRGVEVLHADVATHPDTTYRTTFIAAGGAFPVTADLAEVELLGEGFDGDVLGQTREPLRPTAPLA